ncbi:MAG: efflux RND transporter permease subunit, partial [Pirellulaceae bacterium]|nr:efflux RND transporter permease subunit [Pirellulaceae bacterium]
MITILLRDTRLLVLMLVTIVLAGLSSFLVLPRMEDPVLTQRAAIINTRLIGADADRVESLVTDKIIDEVREFAEVKEISSMSRPNVSTVAVTLKDTIYEVDEVWARIRDKISDLRPQLPSNATAPDVDVVEVRAFASIAALVWNSPNPPVYSVLRRLARDLEEEIRNVPNTESVELFGDPDEEILVEVEQAELAQLGLTVSELSAQVAGSDSKVPAGQMRGATQDMLLEVGGEFDSLSRIGRIPVRSTNSGQTSYLSDIARISKGVAQPPRSQALVDGLPAIMVASAVDPETRIDDWHTKLETALKNFQKRLPPDVKLERVFQQNGYVATRMNDLIQNLFISALTVFLVVFLMMGWRSSWIVGLALPLSSCLVFTGLRIAGIPLHQMSMSGLVIALGMLEGTAIIIVDEVQRRLREGESRLDAVKHGVSHMALPLFGSTITTVLSFLPIATMPGPSGEFVGTIGTSVILALCCSLALSFTIIPTLSALLSPSEPGPPTFWNIGFSNAWLSRIYLSSLRFCFKHPWLTALLGVLISLPGFLALPLFKVQFFPAADRNQFHVEIELSPDASLEETRQTAIRVRDLMLEDKLIERVDWVIGRSAPSFYYNMVGTVQDSPRYAQALVQSKTTYGNIPLIRRLQKRLNQEITNAQVRVRALEQGPPFDAPIELRIFGNDRDQLRMYGEHVREVLQKHPDVIQTKADLTDLLPKLVFDVNEEEAMLAGVDLSAIARQLDATLEGRLGGSILEGTEELPVRVRVASSKRDDLGKIGSIDILSERDGAGRKPVALSSLGS